MTSLPGVGLFLESRQVNGAFKLAHRTPSCTRYGRLPGVRSLEQPHLLSALLKGHGVEFPTAELFCGEVKRRLMQPSNETEQITLRLGELTLTVQRSRQGPQGSPPSTSQEEEPPQGSPPATSQGPRATASPGAPSWAEREEAAARAGRCAAELLAGASTDKQNAVSHGRRNTVFVVLKGLPSSCVPPGFVTRVMDLRRWVGQPPSDSAVFHGWPSLREARVYYRAAGFTDELLDRSAAVHGQ